MSTGRKSLGAAKSLVEMRRLWRLKNSGRPQNQQDTVCNITWMNSPVDGVFADHRRSHFTELWQVRPSGSCLARLRGTTICRKKLISWKELGWRSLPCRRTSYLERVLCQKMKNRGINPYLRELCTPCDELDAPGSKGALHQSMIQMKIVGEAMH